MSGSSPVEQNKEQLLQDYLKAFYSHEKTITTEVNILTIKCKGTPNTDNIKIDYINVATNGQVSFEIKIYINPTVGGTPSFSDVPRGSISQFDTAGTTIAGGTQLGWYTLAQVNDRHIDLREYNIILTPGDTFVVSGIAASSSKLMTSIGWTERITS